MSKVLCSASPCRFNAGDEHGNECMNPNVQRDMSNGTEAVETMGCVCADCTCDCGTIPMFNV